MKIVFICGSLEPGKDGVGDYTKRLAFELAKKGCTISIIALNDSSCQENCFETQESDGKRIDVLRLPVSSEQAGRFKIASEYINTNNFDWLSLQYVPFSFHNKGLAFKMIDFFKKLGGEIKYHIMFHELWVGMHKGAPLKESVWGFLQRRVIFDLINKLNPKLVNTQCSLYVAQLNHYGYDSIKLPLFSNIQIVKNDSLGTDENKLTFVLFGGIHNTGGLIGNFIKEIKAYSRKTNKPVSLLLLGYGGNHQNNWIDACRENEIDVKVLGVKSPEEISSCLQSATYGITTTVFDKVEKSGSVAAMLEHGLSVICVSDPWVSKINFHTGEMENVINYKEGNLETFFNSKKEINKFSLLETVSDKLFESFKSIN